MGKINAESDLTVSAGVKLLASDSDGNKSTGNVDVDDLNDYFRAESVAGAPSSASDAGTAGEVRFVSGFAYFCVATNTWERVAIATW